MLLLLAFAAAAWLTPKLFQQLLSIFAAAHCAVRLAATDLINRAAAAAFASFIDVAAILLLASAVAACLTAKLFKQLLLL